MSLGVTTHQVGAYKVTTPVYEGPLDLLLQLIERAELDITKLALAQVTEQYLVHLRSLQERVPQDVSAFLVVAARLLSQSPDIECILLLLLPYLPGITSDLGAKLSLIYRETGKPLVAYVPHVEKYRMLIEGFELNRIPVSQSIEGAIHMAEAMRRCKPC